MKALLFLLLSIRVFAVTYTGEIEPIVSKKCASCHKGPYIDLRTFPFFSDVFLTQELLVKEMIRRTKLTEFHRMPPINFDLLLPQEIALLEKWLEEGLKP